MSSAVGPIAKFVLAARWPANEADWKSQDSHWMCSECTASELAAPDYATVNQSWANVLA